MDAPFRNADAIRFIAPKSKFFSEGHPVASPANYKWLRTPALRAAFGSSPRRLAEAELFFGC